MFHKVILEWPLAVVYTIHLKVSSLVSPSGLILNPGLWKRTGGSSMVYMLYSISEQLLSPTKGTRRARSLELWNGQCLPEDSSPDFHHAPEPTLGSLAGLLSQLALKHQIESLCTMGHSQAFKCDSTVVWDLSVWIIWKRMLIWVGHITF